MNGDEIRFSGISSFSYANNAQTDDQTLVLTYGQLQSIIEQAVRAATAPLVAEIDLLKQRLDPITNNHIKLDRTPLIQHAEPSTPVANIAPDKGEITERKEILVKREITEISPDQTLISLPIPNHIITTHSLEDVKSELLLEIEKMYNDLQLEIAQDRQRITKLEKPSYGARSYARVDELHRVMRKNGLRQVTFTQAAKLLGITYRRAKQLRALIEEDARFKVVNDPRHKTRRLIRLTDAINGGR